MRIWRKYLYVDLHCIVVVAVVGLVCRHQEVGFEEGRGFWEPDLDDELAVGVDEPEESKNKASF